MLWFREGRRLLSSGLSQFRLRGSSLFLELPERSGDREHWVVPALPLTNPPGDLFT